jgi:hypothetical protein
VKEEEGTKVVYFKPKFPLIANYEYMIYPKYYFFFFSLFFCFYFFYFFLYICFIFIILIKKNYFLGGKAQMAPRQEDKQFKDEMWSFKTITLSPIRIAVAEKISQKVVSFFIFL